MKQRSRWVLPATIAPVATRCFQIDIPDDPEYIAAFKGALYNLTLWDNWQHDDDHNGTLAAQRMLEAYNTIRDCEAAPNMLLRACTLDCGIEYSTDDGATWTCISLESCIRDLADGVIHDRIDDGTLQRPGGQPGPTTPPAINECVTYHVILKGNDKWLVPSPLNAGDTLNITNAKGGWSDGTIRWSCPNGKVYALGICGLDRGAEVGDPVQTQNHMTVILGYDSSSPAYSKLIDGGAIIPNGMSDVDGWIQANDGDLTDNTGQIEFDVTICTSSLWCYDFDFTASDGTWYAYTHDGHTYAVYVPLAGWGFGYGGYNIIRKDLGLTADVWYVDIYRDFVPDSGRDSIRFYAQDGSLLQTYDPTSTDDAFGIHHSYFDISSQGTYGTYTMEIFGDNAAATGHVREVKLRGILGNPIGSDNCTP